MAQDAIATQRRRLIFVHSACVAAIDRLDENSVDELGLITRLQEIVEMVEADLERLSRPG
jgi:hypothetical protein